MSQFIDLKELEKEVTDAAKQATADLSAMLHAKAVELAGERLNTRRQAFIDHLDVSREGDVWILSLDESMNWIEDGLPEHSNLENLLASKKAKTAKDGSKFIVVPFKQGPNKGPTNTTPSNLELVSAVKAHMKQAKIPWSKIERDDNGRPKIGRLHSFDVKSPNKTHEGPGQGWGPVGENRQGPNKDYQKGQSGGRDLLSGVGVYQHEVGGKVQRSVMTFRTASSKQLGTGMWWMSKIPPTNIFEDVYKWGLEEVSNTIIPQILERLGAK